MGQALNQLIAQQQGPDILGTTGRVIQTAGALQQLKSLPIQQQIEQQKATLGQKQLAMLETQMQQAQQQKSLQFSADMAVQIAKEPDPAKKAQIFMSGRQLAQQQGLDVSQWPTEYNDQTQQGLDNIVAHVYGAEKFKTDEEIRKGTEVEKAKSKGPASSVGKLMADRDAAAKAGADAATLKAYDDAIAKVGQGQTISLSINDGHQQLSKPNATKVQENILNAESALSNLDSIAGRFSGDYLTYSGRIKSGAGALLDKAGVTNDLTKMNASRAQFRNEVNQFFNQYRKEITGAAASEKELEQLKESILNPDTGPQEFKAAYDQFVVKVRKQLELNKATAVKGVKVSPGMPTKNAKGWMLHVDMQGNKAYVSPDGAEFEEADDDAEEDQ
jgi:hypothetical protein